MILVSVGVWRGTSLQSVCRHWRACYTEEDMQTAILQHSGMGPSEWDDSYRASELRKDFVENAVLNNKVNFVRQLVFQHHSVKPHSMRPHNIYAAAVHAVNYAASSQKVDVVKALLACWPVATWPGRCNISPGRVRQVGPIHSKRVIHSWMDVAGKALVAAAEHSDFILARMLLKWRNQQRAPTWPLLPVWQLDVPADFSDSCALQTAAKYSHGISRLLLESSPNSAHADCNGGRALRLAISAGSVSNVSLLLNACHHPVYADTQNSSVLLMAVEHSQPEILRLLLETPSHAACADAQNSLALQYAVELGNTEMVAILLNAPANAAHANCENNEPLHIASQHGFAGVARLLLQAKSHAAHADSRDCASLINAASNGDTATAQLLLCAPQHAAPANCRHGEALVSAATGGHLEMVHMLLNAAHHAARTDSTGGQAFVCAEQNKHWGVVQLLLDHAQTEDALMEEVIV